jgi:hypothetical protein
MGSKEVPLLVPHYLAMDLNVLANTHVMKKGGLGVKSPLDTL